MDQSHGMRKPKPLLEAVDRTSHYQRGNKKWWSVLST